MPNSVLGRLFISVALATPSVLLWLTVRWFICNTTLEPETIAEWLKIAVFLLLGIFVLAEAAEKRTLASALNLNFWGTFLVLNWLKRRIKVNNGLVLLNLSGRTSG